MGSNPYICLFTASNKFIFSTHQEKPYSNGCSLLIYKSNSLSMYLNECVQFYPFQLSSLVSDIGGQLGLFVAMSVLTATESLEFCITLLMILFNKQKTKIRGCLPNCCQLVRVLSINTDVLCCSLGNLEMIGWLLNVT